MSAQLAEGFLERVPTTSVLLFCLFAAFATLQFDAGGTAVEERPVEVVAAQRRARRLRGHVISFCSHSFFYL